MSYIYEMFSIVLINESNGYSILRGMFVMILVYFIFFGFRIVRFGFLFYVYFYIQCLVYDRYLGNDYMLYLFF